MIAALTHGRSPTIFVKFFYLILLLCLDLGSGSSMSTSSPLGTRYENAYQGNSSSQSLERTLYHGGSVLSESDCLEGRKACFDCLLKNILLVKESPYNIGGALLSEGEEVLYCDTSFLFLRSILLFVMIMILSIFSLFALHPHDNIFSYLHIIPSLRHLMVIAIQFFLPPRSMESEPKPLSMQ